LQLAKDRLPVPKLSARMPHMFGLAYVLLPFSDQAPGEAITQSLARFERGRKGSLPDEWLAFHDDTAKFREMFEATYSFTLTQGLQVEGGDNWYLSTSAVIEAMQERGRSHWTVRFADIEPDFEAFVERFGVFTCDRHPVTRQLGRWLNPLGQWDWWDLGGCFNGTITGHRRKACDRNSALSSGDCDGRRVFELVSDALCGPEVEAPLPLDVATNENIETVSTPAEALAKGRKFAVPGALVLPPNSEPDDQRWLDVWPDLYALTEPEAQRDRQESTWMTTVSQSYERFNDHWAAAVAYHF
jgi:hypothetical protein